MMIFTENYFLPMWLFCFISPLINFVTVGDNINLTPKSAFAFAKDQRFVVPLYTYVIAETFVWIWALLAMSDNVNVDKRWWLVKPKTASEYFVFLSIMGFFGSLNCVVGHELFHRKDRLSKCMGTWPYTKVMYSHFYDEHLKGHHKTIATVHDPATALMGENAYYFMVKSFCGSHLNVWNYEAKMIRNKYGQDASWWLHIALNKMTAYFIIHFSIMFGVYHIFGYSSFIYNVQYVLISLVFAELVNYIEHYGLLRKKDENGVYESVNKMHSWNYLSGAVLIRLQRHSDHHAHSFRPYQILRRFDDAPYMPYEYLH